MGILKKSFTLIETLISVVLLLVLISGFTYASYYQNFNKEYVLLNKIENLFTLEDYSTNFTKQSSTVEIIINDNIIKNIDIKKIVYKSENIILFKYE